MYVATHILQILVVVVYYYSKISTNNTLLSVTNTCLWFFDVTFRKILLLIKILGIITAEQIDIIQADLNVSLSVTELLLFNLVREIYI